MKPVNENICVEQGIDPNDSNPFRYCGEYWDGETGTYYLRARYYDPIIGRFTQEDTHWNPSNMIYGDNPVKWNEREPDEKDPLGLSTYTYVPNINAIRQSTNLYIYGGNNPLMFIDPTGEEWYHWVVGGLVVAAAAVAVVATAGGAAAAIVAVSTVASGTAAATTATTVAAGAFIGSSAALGTSALVAASKSNSISDFNSQGNWGTVASTVGGGVIGGAVSYVTTKGSTQSNPGVCFVAGIPVATEDGFTPIEQIKSGDVVASANPETGEKGFKAVVQTFVNETHELVHINVDGQRITTTPDHPFYVPKKGWVNAIRLRAGDILVLQSDKVVIIEQLQHEILEAPIAVYNFEVTDWHTYYVSDSAVLVHKVMSL